jgi:hypothetical protein
MSWQPNCAIAEPSARSYEFAMPVAAVKLHVRGGEHSLDLERWSG